MKLTRAREAPRLPAVYVSACCGADIQFAAEETLTSIDGNVPASLDAHVAKMAKHAAELQHASDLAEILPDFAFHLEMLSRIESHADTSIAPRDVDRHPIMFLYARRAAELAGVKVCRDEAAATATEQAQAWCERAALACRW